MLSSPTSFTIFSVFICSSTARTYSYQLSS
uniref:Uncharacterized protein n=1 Tax=Anguilla anguilla TaxID=7936 RepID=A0A0E9U2N9_ANGAN